MKNNPLDDPFNKAVKVIQNATIDGSLRDVDIERCTTNITDVGKIANSLLKDLAADSGVSRGEMLSRLVYMATKATTHKGTIKRKFELDGIDEDPSLFGCDN